LIHALIDPAENILAEKNEHANFLVATQHNALLQFGVLRVGESGFLERESRAGAFEQLSGAGIASKGMEDQVRQLSGERV